MENDNFQGLVWCKELDICGANRCMDAVEPDGADMLSNERIRLMTKMASYEEGKGKEYIPIRQYYRKDYVVLEMIKSFIASSAAFGILFVCWLLYRIEDITEIVEEWDLMELGMLILAIYAGFVVLYELITLGVYNWRYSRAASSIKEYHSLLKKAERLREKEERSLPLED